ncbi:MAG TPA: signal peptidase II [Terriglobales bacterium]|nr:signal peptidase II [Terriglobales bacterium]
MSKYALFSSTAIIAAVLDQLTKIYIRSTMPLYTSIEVVDSFFNLTHVANPGGAFSLFADGHPVLRRLFFVGASTAALFFLLYMIRQVHESQRLLTLALGAILGGAVGNLIDRVWFGAVTDFLDFYWNDHHWPAFNIADSCISVGIAVLMAFSLFGKDPSAQTG